MEATVIVYIDRQLDRISDHLGKELLGIPVLITQFNKKKKGKWISTSISLSASWLQMSSASHHDFYATSDYILQLRGKVKVIFLYIASVWLFVQAAREVTGTDCSAHYGNL